MGARHASAARGTLSASHIFLHIKIKNTLIVIFFINFSYWSCKFELEPKLLCNLQSINEFKNSSFIYWISEGRVNGERKHFGRPKHFSGLKFQKKVPSQGFKYVIWIAIPADYSKQLILHGNTDNQTWQSSLIKFIVISIDFTQFSMMRAVIQNVFVVLTL